MSKKKLIPCRVCKKLFEPCAYCQSHSDVFRWRNFACSKECATKYIHDTIAYREALKNKKSTMDEAVETFIKDVSVEKTTATRKKISKRNSINVSETEITKKKTE